jgi:hypothetical protein
MNQRVFDVPYDLETPAQNVTSDGEAPITDLDVRILYNSLYNRLHYRKP